MTITIYICIHTYTNNIYTNNIYTNNIYTNNITIPIIYKYINIYCHIPLGRPSLMLIPWSSHGFLPHSRRVDDRCQGWDACARLGLWRLLCHPGLSFSAHRSCWLMGFTTLFTHMLMYIYVNLCVYIIVYICVYIYIDNIYIDTYIVCWYYV